MTTVRHPGKAANRKSHKVGASSPSARASGLGGSRNTLRVSETFLSIQGESTYAGLPCFFIRLSGCNLRCRYCDTVYAYAEGAETTTAALVRQFVAERAACVEITGGEPLLQPALPRLAQALLDHGAEPLLLETNGSRDISVVPDDVVVIMDVKCPGSGESGSFDRRNLARLRARDEVKFVIGDRADYEWARGFIDEHGLTECRRVVLFSGVRGVLAPELLGRWILDDRLRVRLQLQLHTYLGLA